MKQTRNLTITVSCMILIFLTGCRKETTADFYYLEKDYYVGDVVYFENVSQNAYYYRWNFGDSTTSSVKNPTHIYTTSGVKQIILWAMDRNYNRENTDRTTYSIRILERPTNLNITVYLNNTTTVVPECNVGLFGSYDDWYNGENLIADGETDSNGMISFTNCSKTKYYINAGRYIGGEVYLNWYIGYVVELTQGVDNNYRVYIEKYSSKSENGKDMYRICKIEKE